MKTPNIATAFMQSRRVALSATLFLGISGFSNAQTVRQNGSWVSVIAWADADATLSFDKPNTNFGIDDFLRIDGNNGGLISFDSFDLDAIGRRIGLEENQSLRLTSASIGIHSTNDTSNLISIFGVNGEFDESTVTFNSYRENLEAVDFSNPIATGPLFRDGRTDYALDLDAGLDIVNGGNILVFDTAENRAPTFIGSHEGRDAQFTTEFEIVSVPEPSSTALLGLGGLALIARRRR